MNPLKKILNRAKCPHCGELIQEVQIEPVPLKNYHAPHGSGVVCLCPHCAMVLAVAVDLSDLRAGGVR